MPPYAGLRSAGPASTGTPPPGALPPQDWEANPMVVGGEEDPRRVIQELANAHAPSEAEEDLSQNQVRYCRY